MPDWSYHPLFRPALFCLPAESSRRITMNLLALQCRIPYGPHIFRALANAKLSPSLKTKFLGLSFPSPVGFGAGIDVDGRATVLIQELGAGYIELGPLRLGSHTLQHHRPRRLSRTQAIACCGADGVEPLDDLDLQARRISIPIGAQLCLADLPKTISLLPPAVEFATLPAVAGESRKLLAEARAMTERPLLLRIPGGWDESRAELAAERALAEGINGVQVAAADPIEGNEEGELIWGGALPAALHLAARLSPSMPVMLSGGVTTHRMRKKRFRPGLGWCHSLMG